MSSVQADSTQENTHTFSNRHLTLLHYPQCIRAMFAQATQVTITALAKDWMMVDRLQRCQQSLDLI